MQMDTRVSGSESTIIEMKVEISVISDWKRFGTVLPITCLSVSTSLVYTDITSPWEWESK